MHTPRRKEKNTPSSILRHSASLVPIPSLRSPISDIDTVARADWWRICNPLDFCEEQIAYPGDLRRSLFAKSRPLCGRFAKIREVITITSLGSNKKPQFRPRRVQNKRIRIAHYSRRKQRR
jgi:hypothetical protein